LYNFAYYLKKRFAIYPGQLEPVSAGFLADHYRARRKARGPVRAGLDWLIGAGFRAWVPFRANTVAKRFGLDRAWAKQASKIGRERFADPNDIALFRIQSADELDQWMRRYEAAGISKLINPANWRADCVLADKVAFARRCAEHGIAHPALLATVEGDVPTILELPQIAEIVLKPNVGEGGSGVQVLDVPEAARADSAAFAAFLAPHTKGLRGTWLVQQRLINHPDMSDIAINALATVRMTTVFDEHGAPEVVTSVLRFPSKADSRVDNIKAGGLMAPIDPATGTLGAACLGRGIEEFERHPISGAAIAGRVLPNWDEAVALAQRAHREAFREYTLVGWDVALTADGPVILEGNGKPCLIVAQRAPRKGLGATRFGELVRYHLERAHGHHG
jgi:glutathione synthase/RimK-type ligase-like ATP-grasp enzyme